LIILDLIRHVKVDGEAALYGKTDVAPLVAENQQLLSQLAKRQDYDVIITSPLQRCCQLARQLAIKENKPLIYLEALQEIDFGLYDGMPFDKIPFNNSIVYETPKPGDKKSSNQLLTWSLLEGFFQAPAQVCLPEAESLIEFNQRVSKAWNNLLDQQYQSLCGNELFHQTQHQSQRIGPVQLNNPTRAKRIAVVVHAGVIRMILAEILAVDWKSADWHQNLKIAYGSLTTITVTQPFQGNRLCQQVSNIAIPLLA